MENSSRCHTFLALQTRHCSPPPQAILGPTGGTETANTLYIDIRENARTLPRTQVISAGTVTKDEYNVPLAWDVFTIIQDANPGG